MSEEWERGCPVRLLDVDAVSLAIDSQAVSLVIDSQVVSLVIDSRIPDFPRKNFWKNRKNQFFGVPGLK